MTTLVWLRNDLRLRDNPALHEAAKDPQGLVVLYLLDEESPEIRPLGGATRWWLHQSLSRLADSLDGHDIPLILRRGAADEALPAVQSECGADRVLWNRRYSAARSIDEGLTERFADEGVESESFCGGLLFEPWTIRTQSGGPYRVYSPFWRACLEADEPEPPLPEPSAWRAAARQPRSDRLDDWALEPRKPNWAVEIAERWTPGEAAAAEKLDHFLSSPASDYRKGRDSPADGATSELSAHLRWGEISPRTVWHAARSIEGDAEVFLSEIGWREFAWHTAYHNEPLHQTPLDRRFEQFPWDAPNEDELDAWRRGETGFGLVDAGMRELWRTGYMHNRVRMVAASLLTKNLLIDWRIGEAWFWDTLVDADEASNPFNWQWVAGCGADAAPYFRIFNPLTQQRRFDPDEVYVNRWAPDSGDLEELIDVKASRQRALAAYDSIKGVSAS